MTIFKSFIMSIFNYCPVDWPFYTQSRTNKMEKIQERALRFICIHVIFFSSQIGRFGISQREIGVSDREIFAVAYVVFRILTLF